MHEVYYSEVGITPAASQSAASVIDRKLTVVLAARLLTSVRALCVDFRVQSTRSVQEHRVSSLTNGVQSTECSKCMFARLTLLYYCYSCRARRNHSYVAWKGIPFGHHP